jgi:S-(hydroxymethyl)glutathione dehydrogenase/alcohol dehydrogenase
VKTQAAVLRAIGQPLSIEELTVPDCAPGQVLVEIAYAGVCHTQLSEVRGLKGEDRFLPHCLGHEASGRVVAIGSSVTKVTPGDRVVLTWIKASGLDVPGTTYTSGSGSVNAGAIATFMQFAVVAENRVVRIPDAMPLREAALLGCAIPTGAGVVFNTLDVQAGRSIAVFGAGGVGLSTIVAAASAGATPIIAVDVRSERLAKARHLGATHIIDASGEDVGRAIRAIVPQGVDYAVEAAGLASTMEAALAAVRAPGGTAVLAGNLAAGERMSLDPFELIRGKKLIGTWGGESAPDTDIPRFVELFLANRLPLAELVSAEYPLADVNRALGDMDTQSVGRALLVVNA